MRPWSGWRTSWSASAKLTTYKVVKYDDATNITDLGLTSGPEQKGAAMKNRILMVDDETPILKSYSRLFRGKYNVDTAEDGASGLEALKRGHPLLRGDLGFQDAGNGWHRVSRKGPTRRRPTPCASF